MWKEPYNTAAYKWQKLHVTFSAVSDNKPVAKILLDFITISREDSRQLQDVSYGKLIVQ